VVEDDADTAESAPGVFEVEREGETLVITPVTNLGELASREIEDGMGDVLRRPRLVIHHEDRRGVRGHHGGSSLLPPALSRRRRSAEPELLCDVA
jgi:hypothetical protein